MTGYAFILGVDGFGADNEPAYEEGIYLDYDKAFAHLKELNRKIMVDYSEDEIDALCHQQVNERWPEFNTYSMVEVEII